MEFILKNGIVYDPANGINGEKKKISWLKMISLLKKSQLMQKS